MPMFQSIRTLSIIFLSLFISFGLPGCGGSASGVKNEIPEFVMAWGSELHTGVMNLVVNRADLFSDKPVHLKIVDAENYDLIQNDKVVAHLKFVLRNDENIDYGFHCKNMLKLP